jgi:hypothetical protein
MAEAAILLNLLAGAVPEVVAAIKNLLTSTSGLTLQQILDADNATWNAILLASKQ